jgi:hypothetical protein
VISWDENSVRYFHPALADLQSGSFAAGPRPVDALGRYFVIASADDPTLFAKFQPGDQLAPGWYALQRLVNRQLKIHRCETRMLWDRPPHDARLRMQLVPNSLLAAIWIQFISAIEGNFKYRQCDQCRSWFAPIQDTRADARFCKVACRLRAHRARQIRARELAGQGMAPPEIAAEMNSKLKTVKGWLKKK